jgi:ATP-binding cassette subfamily F protein 3
VPLISSASITKVYPTQDVLRNVGFAVQPGDRIGVTGANGTGKTTLLRLIAGLDEPTFGTIDQQKGLRLAYLPQDVPELLGSTLWQTMLDVFAPLLELERTLTDLAQRMAEPDCPAAVVERHGELQHDFEERGGYRYVNRIETVLTGLGFARDRWPRPLQELSGGWRTRALLARLLLEEPDILLLDEPTNNLDLDAVCWLEQFLQQYRGNLLIVSHDRAFLDKLCNRIWEIGFARLEDYPGNYTAFRKQRQERYERRLKEWQAQQDYIAKEEDFIRRNIAGQRSQEAKGRRTKLARYLETETKPKPELAKTVHFRFQADVRTGDMVLETRDLQIGYVAGQPLTTVTDFRLERGDRVAIVGPNGAGKTTLLRTLMGQLPPLGGSFRWGANVEPGYLSQSHDVLDPNLTLVDAVRQVQDVRSDADARHFLGALLFSGDEAFKRVTDLSGGQRARLGIARLAHRHPNLMLLDEPTNHLDIDTMDALQDALLAYPGTLLLVSHDRYLVQALATRLIVVADGTTRLLDGSWEDYVASRGGGPPPTPARDAAQAPESAAESAAAGRARYEAERRRENDRKRKQRRYEELEASLHELEDEKRMLEHAIGKAGEAQQLAELTRLTQQYQAVSEQLDRHWAEYAQLAEDLGQ